MNKQLRDEWVKALRSGEYKQTKGALQSVSGYCCLGVLCEVASKAGAKLKRNDNGLMIGTLLGAQFEDEDRLVPSDVRLELMDMNDSKGLSFAVIADYIEARIPVTP